WHAADVLSTGSATAKNCHCNEREHQCASLHVPTPPSFSMFPSRPLSPPSSPSRDRPSCELPHFRLRLLQPEAHVHLAVQRRRGGEVLLSLLPPVRPPVELAEAEMAVGDERTHAARLGHRQRAAVAILAPLGMPTIRIRGDRILQVQGIRL